MFTGEKSEWFLLKKQVIKQYKEQKQEMYVGGTVGEKQYGLFVYNRKKMNLEGYQGRKGWVNTEQYIVLGLPPLDPGGAVAKNTAKHKLVPLWTHEAQMCLHHCLGPTILLSSFCPLSLPLELINIQTYFFPKKCFIDTTWLSTSSHPVENTWEL